MKRVLCGFVFVFGCAPQSGPDLSGGGAARGDTPVVTLEDAPWNGFGARTKLVARLRTTDGYDLSNFSDEYRVQLRDETLPRLQARQAEYVRHCKNGGGTLRQEDGAVLFDCDVPQGKPYVLCTHSNIVTCEPPPASELAGLDFEIQRNKWRSLDVPPDLTVQVFADERAQREQIYGKSVEPHAPVMLGDEGVYDYVAPEGVFAVGAGREGPRRLLIIVRQAATRENVSRFYHLEPLGTLLRLVPAADAPVPPAIHRPLSGNLPDPRWRGFGPKITFRAKDATELNPQLDRFVGLCLASDGQPIEEERVTQDCTGVAADVSCPLRAILRCAAPGGVDPLRGHDVHLPRNALVWIDTPSDQVIVQVYQLAREARAREFEADVDPYEPLLLQDSWYAVAIHWTHQELAKTLATPESPAKPATPAPRTFFTTGAGTPRSVPLLGRDPGPETQLRVIVRQAVDGANVSEKFRVERVGHVIRVLPK
jgi:hypothetical protein